MSLSASRPYRTGMWFFLAVAFVSLLVALAGARGSLPQEVGLLAVGGFFFFLLCAMLLGYKSRRVLTEGHARSSSHTMLVLMAGMLKDQDDETLERIQASGGPAGEAAGLILTRRRQSPQ